MSTAALKRVSPEVRRRNRILVAILVAAMLAVTVSSLLYLRHYGFSTEETQSKYH